MSEERTDLRGARKSGLGKGLNSLLGISEDQKTGTGNQDGGPTATIVRDLDIASVYPNPKQPRKIFDDEELNRLAKSLRQDGVVQPIIVSREGSKYIIVAGERRWRASKIAGLSKIPALIKSTSPDERLRIAIIENVQRANLNVIEEAEAYASLIEEFDLTQEQCAEQVGKDRATIANLLRILQLPESVQNDLVAEKLSMGHGRALMSLQDSTLIEQVRDLVVKNKLNVRQTESLVKKVKKHGFTKEEPKELNDNDLDYLAESLRSHLRTKVLLKGSGARGRIEIAYYSPGELERLMRLIGGSQFS